MRGVRFALFSKGASPSSTYISIGRATQLLFGKHAIAVKVLPPLGSGRISGTAVTKVVVSFTWEKPAVPEQLVLLFSVMLPTGTLIPQPEAVLLI